MAEAKTDRIPRLGDAGAIVDLQPKNPLPAVSIEELPEKLKAACTRAGWKSLTPVQANGLPYLLEGKDMMIQSRTGSGKTGCYLLPMLEKIDPAVKFPQALVLTPTRELARQVEREAQILFGDTGLKPCAIYGGVGYKTQLAALKDGAQVVIGTPGRIMDYLGRHSLNFNSLRMLVFDEADRMLSIGFYPDIKEICRHLPERRQTLLFSATYPPHVLRLAKEFMHDPEMLSLSAKSVHVAEVEHLYVPVKPMDKEKTLIRLLETENPTSAIIFCNTRADTHFVASVLESWGYSVGELSSDLPQNKREAVLAKIRDGEIKYLVATDVAARGIDIPDLSHVFMYEPPQDKESYIHRAGRTGRAGAAGTVINLVDVMEKLDLDRIGKFYHINMREMPAPTEEEVTKSLCERLETILEARLRTLSGADRRRIERYMPMARRILEAEDNDEDKKAAIMALLLADAQISNGRMLPPKEQSQARRRTSGRRPAGRPATHKRKMGSPRRQTDN